MNGFSAFILEGGTGYDTYYADLGDTIRDADGHGKVILNGKQLSFATHTKGQTAYHDAAGNTYIYSGGKLQINDPLVIENFTNGNLGIYFDFNGDGVSEKAGWIAAQDGILAPDANVNNVINNLGELFGSNTQDGFAELREHDGNADGKIDAQDSDFAKLKVWQDANQDGVSQSGELKTLDELGITRIDLATTAINTSIADNLLTAIGSFTRNGTAHLAADIHLAVNFALTDSNPSRPFGLPPELDAEVFDLPWLRGYGNAKSLPIAYQEDPGLRQAAKDLVAQGHNGILQNFDGFMAKWTGLEAAHAAHGVTRTTLTPEDKAWILETLNGQDVLKGAIETANFGTLTFANGRRLDTTYIDNQFQSFVRQEALSFAMQADTKDWLKGLNYSLNLDGFVAADAALLQTSLQTKLAAINNEDDALYAAVLLAKLRADGVALVVETLKQGIGQSAYAPLLGGMGGCDHIWGEGGNDTLAGSTRNDTLTGESVLISGADNNLRNNPRWREAGNDQSIRKVA